MNIDWTSLLIGLLLGWLLEWIIDFFYWRRGRADAGDVAAAQEKLQDAEIRIDELEASLESAKTDLETWQAKYHDLESEAGDAVAVQGDLAQCQANYEQLEAEYAQQLVALAALRNAADEARIRAIGRLTTLDGIDEGQAGLLYEAGISASDDLVVADDAAVQAALGLDDIGYAAWSDRVKAALLGLGAGAAAAELLDEDDEEASVIRAAEFDLDLDDEAEGIDFEPELIVEDVLETYDFDHDGEVDLVVDTITEGLDIDGDGEIDIVLEELIEMDVLDAEAVAKAEAEIDSVFDELEMLEGGSAARDSILDEALIVAGTRAIMRDRPAEADDLTLIQGIGPRFSEKLAGAGIVTFAALAAASDEQLDDAVDRKNWQKLDYDSWRVQALTFAAVPLPQSVGDDLQLIEGIGPKYNELLRAADIVTFAELADTEPERLAEIIGAPAWRNVDYDAWIAQAGLAASGSDQELQELQDELFAPQPDNLLLIRGLGDKYYAALEAAGITTFAALAAKSPAELREIAAAAGLRNTNYEAWIEEAGLRMAGKRVPRQKRTYENVAMVSCPQDLESIEGVGNIYEKRLYEAGIGSYWEVAQQSDEDLIDILEVMPFQDVDLAGIRASALALAIETGTVNQVWDGTEPDDFEPMEGIGVIYERRLYSAGYCTYAALASATVEELERVCRPPAFHKPDFAGWIARAQVLAAAEGAIEE